MPRPKGSFKWPPSYEKHKSGQARVRIPGHGDIYLGKYNTKASWHKYHQVCAQAAVQGFSGPMDDPGKDITIAELCARYWLDYMRRFAPTGNEKDLVGWHLSASIGVRLLRNAYGDLVANEFGPLKLKTIQEQVITKKRFWRPILPEGMRKTPIRKNKIRLPYIYGPDKPFSKKYVGGITKHIKSVFRWGCERELVNGSVYHALTAVKNCPDDPRLMAPRKVEPVSDEAIEATLPYLGCQSSRMVKIQRLTGMRAGELVQMRTIDIDMTPTSIESRQDCPNCRKDEPCSDHSCWVYVPQHHKTEKKGVVRRIKIGPRAQEILKPLLKTCLTDYIFTGRAALFRDEEVYFRFHHTGVLPKNYKPLSRRKDKRRYREHISVSAFNQSIRYACMRANIPAWHTHQLRHAFATEVANLVGIEKARIALSHTSVEMTQRYAHMDDRSINPVISKIG